MSKKHLEKVITENFPEKEFKVREVNFITGVRFESFIQLCDKALFLVLEKKAHFLGGLSQKEIIYFLSKGTGGQKIESKEFDLSDFYIVDKIVGFKNINKIK